MAKKTAEQNLTRSQMVVTLLGTGTPLIKEDQWGPSTLIQAGGAIILFDCGRGASLRIVQSGTPLENVKMVFLTHLHSDHVVGLPDLWLTGWELGRAKPLRLFGPSGTADMATYLAKAFRADVRGRQEPPESLTSSGAGIEGTDIKDGCVLEIDGVKVTAFEVDHGSFKPTLGFRVDYRDRSVVISGDTRYSENLIKFSYGTDVLIHNVWVTTKGQDLAALKLVASPEEAGSVFDQVKPKLAVFSHYNTAKDLRRRTRAIYGGKLLIGRDLTSIEIGSKIYVTRP